MPLLIFAVTTLLAQVVLTLRLSLLTCESVALTKPGSNRINAVTSGNRVITFGLALITLSQLVLGTYVAAYAATEGGESVAECCTRFLSSSMPQRHRTFRSRSIYTRYAFSYSIERWNLASLAYLSYTVPNFPRRSSKRSRSR